MTEAPASSSALGRGWTSAVALMWNDDEGWGVVDSTETPGGCWVHFSHVERPGYHSLTPGEAVWLQWETPGQDGYPCRAIRVIPQGKLNEPD